MVEAISLLHSLYVVSKSILASQLRRIQEVVYFLVFLQVIVDIAILKGNCGPEEIPLVLVCLIEVLRAQYLFEDFRL